jgi:hypothetical protein
MIGLTLAVLLALSPAGNEGDHLYKTLLVRAAPGDLLELIDLYKERIPVYDAGGGRPFMMRHSNGDEWDLLLLFPMKSFVEHFSEEGIARRERAARESSMSEAEFQRAVAERVSWREELFVLGPLPEVVDSAFSNHGYYHVEMFIALPGKQAELLEERRMENAYLAGIDRPQTLIFERVAGAAWDSYTIAFYRDIKDFAGSADVSDERKEASARAAGFDGADRIGTHLRTLIDWHRDTLATAVR